MTTVILYVGISVTFLTVWGVVMVGGYLLGREPSDSPTTAATVDRGTASPVAPDTARLR